MAVQAPKTQGLSHAVFLSRVTDQPATSPEVQLGQAAFLTLRVVDLLAPDHVPVEPEVFHYQWIATERYCADLAHEGTEASHLIGIVRSTREAYRKRNPRLLVPSLFAYVHHLENTLHLEEALDVLETILRVGGERLAAKDAIAAWLRVGLVRRNLAQFDEADAAYHAAEELATGSGDKHSVLLSRIGRAIALHQRGNLAEAEQAVRLILPDAQAAHDTDAEARIEHMLGVVLMKRGMAAEGVPHLWRAFELYAEQAARLRPLNDLGIALISLGDADGAERALREVVRLGGENNPNATLNAQIELMHCSSYRRNRVGFERLRLICDENRGAMTPNMLVDYLLKDGIGQARFGNFRKARQLMGEALAVASANQLHEFEFRIGRIQAGLGDCEEVAREALQATAEPVLQTEALREVSASLALLGA